MVCTLNLKSSYLDGTLVTLPNLKVIVYNLPGVRFFAGLNSIVRASSQTALPFTEGEKSNKFLSHTSPIGCVVEASADN